MPHHGERPKKYAIYTIAVIGFIYTFHVVLPIYTSSSFLSLFANEKTLGIIYMLGAVVCVAGLLLCPFLLRKIGNYAAALSLVVIQMGLIYALTSTSEPKLVALFFILQTTVVALIGFCIDIFLEVYSDTAHVGRIRGMYMTTINSAWVIAPLIGTLIIGASNNYRSVYTASLLLLFPLLYLIFKNFPRFKDPRYSHPSLWQTTRSLLRNRDHSRLFFVNTILQVFFAWMVVYSPIYLHMTVGLSWAEIGIIITIMLLPFPLFEWPLGRLADKKYGEKEIMLAGFALIGLSTISLSAITSKSMLVWAGALFLTRVGAAATEIMIETYFFKTVNVKDPNVLGFFRITRYIAYFIAPLITGLGLLITKDPSVPFIILGLFCLFALIPTWTLKDTN